MTEAILRVQNLTFAYPHGGEVIKGISWSLAPGAKVALLGANGAGKSTLLMLLVGLLRPSSGRFFFRGHEVLSRSQDWRCLRERVGLVFQNPEHQLVAPTVIQDLSFGPLNQGLAPKDVLGRVQRVALEFGLTDLLQQPIHALSYGQKKRVALAGVMVMEPELLLFDEPTLGLDAYQERELEERLETGHRRGQTILISSHNLDFVSAWADRVLVMDRGVLVAEGDPWTILSDDALMHRVGLRPYWPAQLAVSLGLSTLDRGDLMGRVRELAQVGSPEPLIL